MSLSKALAHNQSLVISAIITILCFTGILACHLTETQKKDIITTAVLVGEAAATKAPLPWTQIGLAIGTLLGGGSIIDNRRKDLLIKRLKTENANHLSIFTALASADRTNPPGVPPVINN